MRGSASTIAMSLGILNCASRPAQFSTTVARSSEVFRPRLTSPHVRPGRWAMKTEDGRHRSGKDVRHTGPAPERRRDACRRGRLPRRSS